MPALNSRVVLRSFNDAISAPSACRPTENYWLLIGETGTVIDTTNADGRILVQFDRLVSEHGLACHNPVPNSLLILESDLEKLP